MLSIDTLSQLLTAQNFDMPAGYVNDADGTQYIVQVGDKVKSVDDLNNLVLMDMNMDGIDPIRVSDVANVEITDNSGDNYAVINGNPGIMKSIAQIYPASCFTETENIFSVNFKAIAYTKHATIIDKTIFKKIVKRCSFSLHLR